MSRFILRYTGKDSKPAADVSRICAEGHARILDDSSPRMVLVEGPEHPLRAAVEKLGNWNLSVEQSGYELPDPHPGVGKVKTKPGKP
jgi:hypothetical protein